MADGWLTFELLEALLLVRRRRCQQILEGCLHGLELRLLRELGEVAAVGGDAPLQDREGEQVRLLELVLQRSHVPADELSRSAQQPKPDDNLTRRRSVGIVA